MMHGGNLKLTHLIFKFNVTSMTWNYSQYAQQHNNTLRYASLVLKEKYHVRK